MFSFPLGTNESQDWTMELSSLLESMNWNGNPVAGRQCLDTVLAILCIHAKTDRSDRTFGAHTMEEKCQGSRERRKVDRETCRATNGASIVIPNVIGFLWDHKTATVPVDLSMLPSQFSWMKEENNE